MVVANFEPRALVVAGAADMRSIAAGLAPTLLPGRCAVGGGRGVCREGRGWGWGVRRRGGGLCGAGIVY